MSKLSKQPRRAKKRYLVIGIILILSAFTGLDLKTAGMVFLLGAMFVFIYLCLYAADKHIMSMKSNYEALINFHGNTNLDELAVKCGKSYKGVCKDIQSMINAGEFKDVCGRNGAYIDKEKHYLIMLQNGKPIVPLKENAKKAVESKPAEQEKKVTERVDLVKKYIDVMSKVIQQIDCKMDKKEEDVAVRNNLVSMTKSIKDIQAKVEKHPEFKNNNDVITLFNNRLPQTVELIGNYFDETSSEKVLTELSEMLSISAKAFARIDKELSETLDAETMANIEVLKSGFERDGLVESDFEMEAEEEA